MSAGAQLDFDALAQKYGGTPAQAAASKPLTVYGNSPKGLVEPGNIDLNNRPTIQNSDGSHSTEYSTSFGTDKGEVLVPTIVNGKFLTPDGTKPPPGSPQEKAMFKTAADHYKQTGQHMGIFDTPESADAYATAVHNRNQTPDYDALAQKHGGTVASQGTPIPNTSTIGPEKTAPLESNFIDDAEGLTQEGRKEHPIKAAVGDVARSAGQLRDIVAPEVAVLAPGLAAGPGAAPAPEAPPAPEVAPAAAPAPEPLPVNPVQRGPGEIAREQVGAPPGVLPKPFSSTVGSRELPGGGMLVRPGLLSQGTPQSLSDWLIGGGSSAPAPEVAPAAVPTVPASPAAAPAPKPAMQSLTDWLNQTTTKAQPPPQPLSYGVPLREQVSNTNPVFQKPPSELATRRPDLSAPQRQFAHANSEEALDAIGGNADLMKSFHSLKNADIAGVYEKAGGPVGAQPGEAYTGPPSRQAQIQWLLKKGVSPDQIVAMAKGK